MSRRTKQEMNELCGHSFGAPPVGKSKPDPLLQQPEGICSPSANSRLRLKASCLQKLLPPSSVHQPSSVWTFWTPGKTSPAVEAMDWPPTGPENSPEKTTCLAERWGRSRCHHVLGRSGSSPIPSSACLPLTKMAPFRLIEGSSPGTPWQASRSRRGAGTTLQKPLVFRSRVVSLHNANTAQKPATPSSLTHRTWTPRKSKAPILIP